MHKVAGAPLVYVVVLLLLLVLLVTIHTDTVRSVLVIMYSSYSFCNLFVLRLCSVKDRRHSPSTPLRPGQVIRLALRPFRPPS